MACDIKYKGVEYTRADFEDYIKSNPQEFAKIMSDNADSNNVSMQAINYNDTPVKSGVDNLFEENEELSKIGSKQLYSAYLDTIFPDSKVKDIVYRGTPENYPIKKGISPSLGEGITFTSDKNWANTYTKDGTNPTLHIAIINITNPIILNNKIDNLSDEEQNKYLEIKSKKENDGTIVFNEYLVIEPEQIHILGSKQDLERFKSWVDINQSKLGVSNIFESNPELANIGTEQLYAQYLESLNKPNTNPILQGNQKPDVILPIGTSGSGKSTFIKSLPQENLVVIEPDAMRVEFTGDMNDKSKDKEIYEEAAKRAVQAIKQGKQVVFDTTNLTKDKRLPFIEAIKKGMPNANIQYKLMELNPELAKQRIKAQLERGENRANVPDATIDRHAESYKQMLEDIKNEPISNFDGQQEQVKKFAELQERLNNKEFLEGAKNAYEGSEELQNVYYEAAGFVKPLVAFKDNFQNVEERLNDISDPFAENLGTSGLPSDYYNEVEVDIDSLDLSLKDKEMFDILYKETKTSDYLKSELTSIGKQKTPILINNKGQVVEGWHRIHSLKANGVKTIKAYIPITPQQKQDALNAYTDYIARVSLGIIKNPSSGEYNYDSKVEDIVYHGSKYNAKLYNGRPLVWYDDVNNNESHYTYDDNFGDEIIKLKHSEFFKLHNFKFEKFKKPNHLSVVSDTFLGSGIYFGDSFDYINKIYNKSSLYPAIINVKNLYTENNGYNNSRSGKSSQELIDKGYDGVTELINNSREYNVFEPEQIHILSSKADIEGFKESVDNNQSDVQYQKQIDLLQEESKTPIQELSTDKTVQAKNAKEPIKLTEEQIAERQDYGEIIGELNFTVSQTKKAQDNFNDNQDLSLQVLPDFSNIDNSLTRRREKLLKARESFKSSENASRLTKPYRDKLLEYTTAIKSIDDRIQGLDTSDRDAAYNFLLTELNEIDIAMDNYGNKAVDSIALMDRLDFLHSYVLGRDLKDNSTDSWDFTGIPDYEKDLVLPVSELKNKLITRNRERAFEIIRELPAFVNYQKENAMSNDQVREMFDKTLSDNLKDINSLQENWLGLDSNDDSLFTTAIMNLYHRDIAIAKNPVRELSKEMAEINEQLNKEGYDSENFKEKNSRGVVQTVMANIVSSDFNNEVLPKYYSALSEYYKTKDHLAVNKSKAFSKVINFLKTETDVTDYSKMSHIKDMYGTHPELSKYFIHSDADMKAYEQEQRAKLGEEYDTRIQEASEKILNYLDASLNSQVTKPAYHTVFMAENNPFVFLEQYNSTNAFDPVKVGNNFYRYNLSQYIDFSPKEFKTNPVTKVREKTNYINESYKKEVMSNPKAYELSKMMNRAYANHINPAYIESGQEGLRLMSWAKLNSTLSDVILQNYSTGKGLAKISKAFLDTYKDSWYHTQQEGDPKRLKDNYFDSSASEINTMVTALQAKSLLSIKKMAIERGIPTREASDITQGLSPVRAERAIIEYKKQLARDIATKDYTNRFSGNIVRNTLALMELSVIQRARLHGQEAVEILANQHKMLKDKHGHEGGRAKSNEKLETWISTNIYNTAVGEEDKKLGEATRRLTEFDKELSKILKGLITDVKSGEEVTFTVKTVGPYGNDIVTKYITAKGVHQRIDAANNLVVVSENEFYKALEEYIAKEVDKLGSVMTIESVVNGVIGNMTKSAFFLSPVSGAFNRWEGKITNMINDWLGTYWTPGNNQFSEEFLSGVNLIKLSPDKIPLISKNHVAQIKTLQKLVEEMNILQDRKNEVEKRDKQSTYGELGKLGNVYAMAIDNPEFKNQITIMLNMLQDVVVKDNNGVEYPFFNPKTKTFTIYKPGTLELKPEFSDNNKSFENFLYDSENPSDNAFFNATEKVSTTISEIQGNYSNVDSIKMRSVKGSGGLIWGKILSMYMRWAPAHANQRFGSRKLNIVQNKKNQKGRYHSLIDNPLIGSAFVAGTTALALGPVALVAGAAPLIFGLSRMVYNQITGKKSQRSSITQMKSAVGFLQHVTLKTIGLPLKLVRVGNKLSKNTRVNQALHNNYFLDDLSEQDQNAIKAVAQELAVGLFIFSMTMLVKSMLGGGSDDDEEKNKLQNFVDNQGNRLISTLTVWSNPVILKDDFTQFAILRYLKDAYKLLEDAWKMNEGDKIDVRRPMKAIVKLAPVPVPNVLIKMVSEGGVGALIKDEREYKGNQWFDRYTKTDAWIEEKKYAKERADYKQAYKDELLETILSEEPDISEEDAIERVDKEADSYMRRKENIRQKDESYKDARERMYGKDSE